MAGALVGQAEGVLLGGGWRPGARRAPGAEQPGEAAAQPAGQAGARLAHLAAAAGPLPICQTYGGSLPFTSQSPMMRSL